MLVLMLADFVNGHNVGMVQLGGGFRLRLETPHVGLRCELAGQDHFQGDQPLELDLPGLVDNAHASACNLLQQLVFAEVTHDS